MERVFIRPVESGFGYRRDVDGLRAVAVLSVVFFHAGPWSLVLFAIPFLVLLSEPVSGLINLVIIGIGLLQAWRITQPDRAPILGPER